jgi:uncharacterized membrane protein YphA (DoxX/SURF4 family)
VLTRSRPFAVGFLTALLMVALRVMIGWHFFQEGLSHKKDPKWSSEGFLHQARGPLVEQYKREAPGPHDYELLIAKPLVPAEPPTEPTTKAEQPTEQPLPQDSPIYGRWYVAILKDWEALRGELAKSYRFTDEQVQQSKIALDHYDKNLAESLKTYEPDISLYRHELWRNEQLAATPGAADIPNLKNRLARRGVNPVGEPGIVMSTTPADWRSTVAALETAFERDVLALRDDNQTLMTAPRAEKSRLEKIDTAATWVLIIGGGCLIVGLFTRLSAFVLALFLASVIASQPPWLDGSVPTYFQGVELVALLLLASSHVGRWAGLDFFLHPILTWPYRRSVRRVA